MKTPICDFVKEYEKKGALRLHMPGHKGRGATEKYDITEIVGADVLYDAEGIIKESEEIASRLFGTAGTYYSTEGSSLCIRAMLSLVKMRGGKPLVAAGRNAHKAFVSAAALCGFEIDWLCPDSAFISCNITPDYVENYLEHNKPSAVYITSPDYLGNILPVGEIAKVCHKYGVLLLVDNAHGAYLNFLTENRHPIALGADMCCDSAHKTLPVLTGGAYLHIANEDFCEQAESALSLFASTSPSYLILQSLDKANEYLETYKSKLATFEKKVAGLKDDLENAGYTLCGDEVLKITLKTKAYGYKGTEIAGILAENGIVCEFSDADYTVMMLTPEMSEKEMAFLKKNLVSIPPKTPITEEAPLFAKCEKVMSVREAVFAPSECVNVSDSVGRILSDVAVSCPPAVPIAVCGEMIDEKAVKLFEYYGINSCRVVKK